MDHPTLSRRAFTAAAALVLSAPALVSAAEPAGRLAASHGRIAVRRAGAARALSDGDPVFQGDVVITGALARARIDLRDETTFSLGENAEFAIDAFVFEPNQSQGAAGFSLLKGAFRMVTGLAAKAGGPDGRTPFVVQTPVATIGVRGTDFWGLQSAARLDLALLGGGPITLSSAGGVVSLRAAPFVSVIDGAAATPTPPRRLGEDELNAAAATVAF